MKNALIAIVLAATVQAQVRTPFETTQVQGLPPIAPLKPAGVPFVRSYESVTVPALRSPNTSHLYSLIRAGNLYLTVPDALALAIEASLDLEIERYSMVTAQWQVQRAASGGPLRGVTGANAPSVSLGAGQGIAGSQRGGGNGAGGGTATIAGAALVQQIGPVTPQLDPIYTAQMAFAHQTTPLDQIVYAGENAYVDTARSYYFRMSEGLLTGGTIRETYNGSYLNEAVPLDVLNPTSYLSLGISFSHRLLNGFGERVNGRFIRIARRHAANSEQVFRQRLIGVVNNTLNLYWDLSVAASDMQYKQKNYDIASTFLADTEKQIAAGAVPAIDRVRAHTAVAQQQQALTVAQSTLLQRENAMKDAVSWHGRQDPRLDGVHVIAVDPLVVPGENELPPLEQLLAGARQRRPDVAIAVANAEVAQLSSSGTANGLLPNLGVFASSSNVGQTGQRVPGASPDTYFVGGAGSALGEVFRRNFPNERVAAQYSELIHNTQAQADFAIDQLTHRQTQLATQRTMNQLAVDIANQVLALQQARARYQSAMESRRLLESLLTGEEKKLLAGTSTISTVVNARRDLATSQSTELAAAETYMRNRIALDQATGNTLEANHISVDDALGK
ncbi:MAG TPA: TolC family protein [Bryobacteraceae bacterium]|nr:TolC family protein [Bryobacteraceae bacterium]